MKRPKTETHKVKRCDGSIATWRDKWVSVRDTCGECGQDTGRTWENHGPSVGDHVGPMRSVRGKSGAECSHCGKYVPGIAEILAEAYSPSAFAAAFNRQMGGTMGALITGIQDPGDA